MKDFSKLVSLPNDVMEALQEGEMLLVVGGNTGFDLFAVNNGSGTCSSTNNGSGICSNTNNNSGICTGTNNTTGACTGVNNGSGSCHIIITPVP